MIRTVLREASTSGQSFSGNFLPSLLYSAHTSVVRMKPGGTGRPMLLICPRHNSHQELRPMSPAFSSTEEQGIARARERQRYVWAWHLCSRWRGRADLGEIGSLAAEERLHVLSSIRSLKIRNVSVKTSEVLGKPQTMCMPGAVCAARRGMLPHRRR
jgi:hypothetical protein